MKTVEYKLCETLAVEIRNIFVCSLREEGISNQIADSAAVRFFSKLHYFLDQLSDDLELVGDYNPDSWVAWDIYR